jgi:hypothetical protein
LALAALIFAVCSLAFSLAALWIGARELRALVHMTPQPLQTALTVVIPARNEPEIAQCVRSVLADPQPLLRVIVVDDRSTDETAQRVTELARADARVRLLQLTDDPAPGVFGKPRALAAGLAAAPGTDALLFLDADVVLAPGALGAVIAAKQAAGAHALSGVPALAHGSLAEELFVPAIASVVTARFLPTRVHAASDATAFLNGQLIALDRESLAAVGGWESVSHTVLEDVALAQRLKANGKVLRLADLRSTASTRMYASVPEILAGFGKNATALLGASAGVVGVSSLVVALFPWLAVVLALSQMASQSDVPIAGAADEVAAVAAVWCAALSLLCALVARTLARQPRWPVLVLPLAYAGAAWILARASLRHLRKAPVAWKGRSYPRAPHR